MSATRASRVRGCITQTADVTVALRQSRGTNRMICTGRLRRAMSSHKTRNCSPVVLFTAYAFTNARPLTVLPTAPWGAPDTFEYVVAEKPTRPDPQVRGQLEVVVLHLGGWRHRRRHRVDRFHTGGFRCERRQSQQPQRGAHGIKGLRATSSRMVPPRCHAAGQRVRRVPAISRS
jgi:hypothetical protein